MFCHQCGTKLPDDAKFCLKCGAKLSADYSQQKQTTALSVKKKRKKLPIVLGVIAGIILIIIVLALAFGGSDGDNSGSNPNSKPEKNSASEQYSDSDEIGKTKTFSSDVWGNLEVTLNSVDFRNSYNDSVPSNGFVYLCANFTVKNLGSTNGALPSGWNTITYDGQYEFIGIYMGEETTLKPMSPPMTVTLVFEVPSEAQTSGKPLVLNLNDVDNSLILSFAFRGGSSGSQPSVAEDACFVMDRDEYKITQLTLYPDGSFDMNVNLYAGEGKLSGSYTSDDYGIYCYVTARNFDGFAGDDVTEFEFSFAGDRLVYHGEMIGMIMDGSYFSPVE